MINNLLIKINKKHFINLVLIFLIVFLSGLAFSLIDADPLHDGIILKAAIDLAEGKMIFRDTYSHYGPLSPIIQAIPIYIFGNYLIVMRITTVVFYALTTVFLFLIWSRFLSQKFAILSVIFWTILAPYYLQLFFAWPSVYGIFFLTVTIYLYLKYLEEREYKKQYFYLILVGIFSCFSFLSKQPYLLTYISIIFIFFLNLVLKMQDLRSAFKNSVLVSFGFFSVLLIFLLWFALTGAFTDFWLQVVREGYTEGRIVGTLFMQNFISLYSREVVWILIMISNVFCFFKSIFELRKNKDNMFYNRLLAISVISLAGCAQIWPTVDPSHTYWAVAPAFGLFFYVLSCAFTSLVSKRKDKSTYRKEDLVKVSLYTFFVAFCLLSLVSTSLSRINSGVERFNGDYIKVSSPEVLKGMYIPRETASFYKDISLTMDEYLNKYPDKRFVINMSEALYLTFTDKSINVIPVFGNYSGYTSGYYNFEQDLAKYIEKNQPLVMVYPKDRNLYNYKELKAWNLEKVILIAPKEFK